jgi:hypothetical protein
MFATMALAEGTRTWDQTRFDQFEKGTTKGVAIRSDGTLELAPSFKSLYTTPSTYIWALAADNEGNVFAAAGAPARVYHIAPNGQATVVFKPAELQVQSLIASGGAIYAATSPDGKVYKIEHRNNAGPANTATDAQGSDQISMDPSYTSSVFFDPKTKYIWDMKMDAQGNLYVATGDHGEIFKVQKNGQGALFFKSDEAHIRALAFDGTGNLIAGTDGSGLIYRITPMGDGFVLYSAPKKEITALAVDPAGNIYAAGTGEKRNAMTGNPGAGNMQFAPMPMAGGAQPQGTAPGMTGAGAPGGMAAPAPFIASAVGGNTGSDVYQIAPDGAPRRVWSSREDMVYALAFDRSGRLLAGTGNKGRVFSIENEDRFTDLLKASASQVTAFATAPNGSLYVASSNLGKVFLMGADPDTEGSYQSDVFDAKNFSRWGRVEVRGSGPYDMYVRTGNVDNPDRNWSPWQKIEQVKGGSVTVPPARFIQWKTVLHPGTSPAQIESVTVNYLPKNVAPEIDEVAAQVGARIAPLPKVTGPDMTTINLGSSNAAALAMQQQFDAPLPAVRDRDAISVRWSAHDDNDDDMVYSLYYRGDEETRWKLLKGGITDKYYTFDSGLLPDGGYTIKVVASDSPSHSPEDALTGEQESSRFEVDNTPPQIVNLNAAVEGDQLRITFRAIDSFSNIQRAEYSIDNTDWQYVEPVGKLSDSRTENYDLMARVPGSENRATELAQNTKTKSKTNAGAPPPPDPVVDLSQASPGEHLVLVRVWDRYDNMSTAKVVVHAIR